MSSKFDLCEQSVSHGTFSLGNGASVGHGSTLDHSAVTAGQSSNAAIELSPSIDLPSLLRRCLDDTTFCGMILHKFAARASDQLASLQRALESANILELAREAHTLAGVSANLSAESLRDCADQLERAATGNNLVAARAALERTRTELTRCAESVPRLIERLSA